MVFRQIRFHFRVAEQLPNVNHRLQQVRRVLPVEPRIEILLLFGFLKLLSKLTLLLVRFRPRRLLAVGLRAFRHRRFQNQPASERRRVVVAGLHQLQDLELAILLDISQLLRRLQVNLIRVERLHHFGMQLREQTFVQPVADALHTRAPSRSSSRRVLRVTCEASASLATPKAGSPFGCW